MLVAFLPNVANNISATFLRDLHDRIQILNVESDVFDAISVLRQMSAELLVIGVVWRDENENDLQTRTWAIKSPHIFCINLPCFASQRVWRIFGCRSPSPDKREARIPCAWCKMTQLAWHYWRRRSSGRRKGIFLVRAEDFKNCSWRNFAQNS